MGDLVATCTSKLSRNYRLGYNLGKGMNLKEAKEEIGQVAEGIRTLQVIRNESLELDIKMPLVESLYNIMYSGSLPDALISDLVNNPYEVDVEFKY
jgi:glycerol-3-phosphate dehydrogenase (NAD(P)+)